MILGMRRKRKIATPQDVEDVAWAWSGFADGLILGGVASAALWGLLWLVSQSRTLSTRELFIEGSITWLIPILVGILWYLISIPRWRRSQQRRLSTPK